MDPHSSETKGRFAIFYFKTHSDYFYAFVIVTGSIKFAYQTAAYPTLDILKDYINGVTDLAMGILHDLQNIKEMKNATKP